MDEDAKYTLETETIRLMFLVSLEVNFTLREGDGPLASLDRLLPDFYQIFANSADLSYMPTWGLSETIIIVAPFFLMLLIGFLIMASRAAQVSLDLLVSLSVSCSHIWQHGQHLSNAASRRPRSSTLRLLRWLNGTDQWVEKAWSVMRLTKLDTKAEMLRHLSSTVRRIRDENALLQKRHSLVKEGPATNAASSP